MTAIGSFLDWVARTEHPRLLVLVLLGAAVLAVGGVLLVVEGSRRPGLLGFRLAVLGALILLFGSTGYLAFAIFDRGFD